MIHVPDKIGSTQAIYYDINALKWCCEHIEKNNIEKPIVYILASRIGMFEKKYVKRIHMAEGQVYQNPDGKYKIITATEEKPVKSMLYDSFVAHHNYREMIYFISSVITRNSLCAAEECDVN